MQWSRAYLPKEIAEKKVLEFVPQKLDLGTPEAALEYLEHKKHGSDFRMNEHVQVQTGVSEIETMTESEKSEARALELLAEIQQNAYQEAYQLGLDEGRKKAFEEHSAAITGNLAQLADSLAAIGNVKHEIVASNEAHMMKLLFHMASRLAGAHLEADQNAILEVLKNALQLASDDENVRVQLNPAQLEFVEEVRKRTGREFEFLKKLRLEPNPSVRPGGCVVETNYGEIDARVEQRVQQLWESVAELAPRVKERIEG